MKARPKTNPVFETLAPGEKASLAADLSILPAESLQDFSVSMIPPFT
jgi:hypothetical protein